MKKTLIFAALMLLINTLFSQNNCKPEYPQFAYVSTMQVNEDRFGIDSNYNYIAISITKDSITFESEQWSDTQYIKWELVSKGKSRNGNPVYQFEGRSQIGLYIIPVVFKDNRWYMGYLIERLCVGVDSTQYRTARVRVNEMPVATKAN